MESVNGTLTVECVNDEHFATREQARREIVDYIGYDNSARRHSSLGYVTPAEFERRWMAGHIDCFNPGIQALPLLDSNSTDWTFAEAQWRAPSGITQVKFFALFVDLDAGASGGGDWLELKYSVRGGAGRERVVRMA